MKKLLLGAIALSHALTVYTMDDMGLKTLSINENNQSIITRAAISTPSISQTTNNTSSTEIEQHEPAKPSGELRQEALNPYGSFRNRISVSDPYPIDDDSDWDIISAHDIKNATLLDEAQNILLTAQQLLPAELKSCINTTIYESEHPLSTLESARQLIWACITRTDPNFATSYVETLNKNFDPCKPYDPNFDYSNVYAYFAYDNDVAMQEPNATFAALIQEKLDKAVAENDEKTQWFMRQFGFMFRDPATKQTYDAYLKGGIDALNALIIPEDERDSLQDCLEKIMSVKFSIKELLKEQK